jgi:hypothetical protein
MCGRLIRGSLQIPNRAVNADFFSDNALQTLLVDPWSVQHVGAVEPFPY